MFVIQMPDGSYVVKHDGWNLFVADKREATRYPTREDAHYARPGHHRDMGGTGYKGRVVPA